MVVLVLLAKVENKNTGKSHLRTTGESGISIPAYVSERSFLASVAAPLSPLLTTEDVGELTAPMLILHHRKFYQMLE
jgi:hypothetical protein